MQQQGEEERGRAEQQSFYCAPIQQCVCQAVDSACVFSITKHTMVFTA
jgi:hypothetical protein